MNNKITISVDPDLESLIPGFMQNRRKDVEILMNALETRDFTKIQSTGHSLKGVGGGYGFDHISDLGASLESAARQQDAQAVTDLINELSDYLDRVEVTFE